MNKIQVGNRKRCQTLADPGGKPENNPGAKLTSVGLRHRKPYHSAGIHSKGNNVDGPASVLENEWHPEEVSHPLHQARSGDEEGDPRDLMKKVRSWLPKEGLRHIQDGYGRASREESAHEDC